MIKKEKKYTFTTPCNDYYNFFSNNDPYAKYEFLSPFELKNTLIYKAEQGSKINNTYLNAGRGNPNFLSIQPRLAFSLLNIISCELCNNLKYGLATEPDKKNISKKFYKILDKYKSNPGYNFLVKSLEKAIIITKLEKDDLIHQLTISTLGSFYPVPPRIHEFNELITKEFIEKCIFKSKIKNKVNLFATEGASAGIMYTFNSLLINGIINKGDKIGIITPIFSPYLEIPNLEKFKLKTVCIQANKDDEWNIPLTELYKLKDTNVKALFLVNPGNPTSVSLSKENIKNIVNIVKEFNPNLIILTDDVYSPFVDEYNSLYTALPENTIYIYSYSKYFGVTGWRLGLIMLSEKNVIDSNIIPNLTKIQKDKLIKRYKLATLNVEKLPFIERLVLDSREVAEAHTGGLSTPQQVMMTLFSLQELIPEYNLYNGEIKKILKKRLKDVCKPIKYKYITNSRTSYYYIILDLIIIAENLYDKNFAQWIHNHLDPLYFLFILAEKYSTVLLPGLGFAGPAYSVRISLANLKDEDYPIIGNNIKHTFEEIYKEYIKTKLNH